MSGCPYAIDAECPAYEWQCTLSAQHDGAHLIGKYWFDEGMLRPELHVDCYDGECALVEGNGVVRV